MSIVQQLRTQVSYRQISSRPSFVPIATGPRVTRTHCSSSSNHVNRPRVQMVHDSARVYSTNTGTSDYISLHDALVPQDPHRRIRFTVPDSAFNWDFTRLNIAQRIWRSTLSIEPHLVPMYMVVYLNDLRRSSYKPAEGKVDTLYARKYMTSTAFSISAAGPNHWSHGLIQIDGPWNREQFGVIDRELASPLPLTQMIDGLRTAFIQPKWDKLTAPLFEYGPPVLNQQEAENLAQFHQAEVKDTSIKGFTVPLRPTRAFFFPMYKILYLVDRFPDRISVMDTTYDVMSKVLNDCYELDRKNVTFGQPTYNDTFRHGYVHKDRFITRELHEAFDKPDRDLFSVSFSSKDDTRELYQTAMRAMIRNPISPLTWGNRDIMPLDGVPGKSMSDVKTYCDLCMFDKEPLIAPAFFEQKIVRPQLAVRPARSRPLSNAASSTSSAPSTSLPPRVRIAAKTDHKRARDKLAANQAAEAVRAQRLWGPLGAKLDMPRRKPTTSASTRPPADPEGHYKTLTIELTSRLLDGNIEDEVNEEIKMKYYALSRAAHPDTWKARTGAGEAEETGIGEQSNADMMTLLNLAYEAIETLQQRRAYARK